MYKTIYAIWTGICVCSVPLAVWLDTVNPGGQQAGMTFLAYFIPVAFIVYGTLAGIFLLLPGPKSVAYVCGNRLILSGVIGLFGYYWLDKLNDTDTVDNLRVEGRIEMKTERDYYKHFGGLKAVRHYRNLYPDSIWGEYNRWGKVTERTVYR